MPEILRVRFRRDSRTDGGRLVTAFAEDLDLDQLTPRARALAESLHESMQHPEDLAVHPLDVVFESDLTNAERAAIPPVRPAAYGPPKDPDDKAQQVIRWGPLLAATADTTLVEWIEDQARQIPEGWYPIGVRNQPRVLSWEAGRDGWDDRFLSKDGVLEYLREHGAPMTAQAWDTLIGTGHLPEPDRYLGRRPLWQPATLNAYIARPRERWTISRVAEYLSLTAGSARVQMRRWGLTAEGRAPGRGGESEYAADQVQAAHAHRPGRGARTDLRQPQEQRRQ